MNEPERRKLVLLGAGKIGAHIAKHWVAKGVGKVLIADQSADRLKSLERQLSLIAKNDTREVFSIEVADVSNREVLKRLLKDAVLVVSACSFQLNQAIAEVALNTGCSYFDLTEDVATTKLIKTLAAKAKPGQIFMPQCGLAPGFIGILANHLAKGFDELDFVKMRVGALPLYPSNMMMYNLTWSTDGLINEYCNACEAIVDGKVRALQPLEGLERFSMDGVDYEAFNTSGGLGTLCETFEGKLNRLDYKTVRYDGHCHLMKFLTQSLRLGQRRELLKDILEKAVPMTLQDVVLVFCSVAGYIDGKYVQNTNARKIYHGQLYGESWSSIQLTTASGLAAVVDLHLEGKLPTQGFVSQEAVAYEDFIENRFGSVYQVNKEGQ